MCGIAGFIPFKPSAGDTIQRMTDSIRHRGPDDEGFALFESESTHIFGGRDTPRAVYDAGLPYTPRGPMGAHANHATQVALGFRRLAIIDVSPAGHQPMSRPDRRSWIVFNGAISNYV